MTVEVKKAWIRVGFFGVAGVAACVATAKYSETKFEKSKIVENKNQE